MLLSVLLGTEITAALPLCIGSGNMTCCSSWETSSVCLVSIRTLCQKKREMHIEEGKQVTPFHYLDRSTPFSLHGVPSLGRSSFIEEATWMKVLHCDWAETLAVLNINPRMMNLGDVSECKQWVGAQLGIAMVWLYNPLFGQISLPRRRRSQCYI